MGVDNPAFDLHENDDPGDVTPPRRRRSDAIRVFRINRNVDANDDENDDRSKSIQILEDKLDNVEDNAEEENVDDDETPPHRRKSTALKVTKMSEIDMMNYEGDKKNKRRKSSFQFAQDLKMYFSKERPPHIDHYRMSLQDGETDSCRPTLDDLLESNYDPEKVQEFDQNVDGGGPNGNDTETKDGGNKAVKLGWIRGVFVPCLLNIWGVMLFIRMTWVVGQAGILEGIAVITLSNVVTLITTISMSAVSTNGQIKGGGVYYMISRSLGPEFGGAIGLMFTLANAIAVAMYIIGFCESLLDMLKQYMPSFNGIVDSSARINDIRVIGTAVLILVLILAIVGMDWVTRVQLGLLVLLIAAQIDFIVGSFLKPSDEQKAKGFVGYNATVLAENLWNAYDKEESEGVIKHNFFTIFAVFFPAVTGIVAGANISGDLKNPGIAIPKGTLLAILVTYITYVSYAVMSASCSLRLASGKVDEVGDTEGESFDDCSDRECQYGLLASQQMMELVSAWGPLIYIGCFAATLSSALASLVGAPRVFQAVAKDKLFPFISVFSVGYGASNNPIRAYFLVFVITLICVLIANLNIVSSLLSNFFVAAYALINFSVFHASITKSPGWRPAFKYYNKWVSLFGTVLCIVVMFLMDYITALITFLCIIALYMWVHFRNPDANWGSSSQSQPFVLALKSAQKLIEVDDHVKNYRPKVIVLSGKPEDRPNLIDFGYLLTKNMSLLECCNVVDSNVPWRAMEKAKISSNQWLRDNKIKAFVGMTRAERFPEGVRHSLELTGLGKLSPNMLLIGFCQRWHADVEGARDYIAAIQSAFELRYSVGILRLSEGFDTSKFANQDQAARPRTYTNDSSDGSSAVRPRTSTESTYHSDDDEVTSPDTKTIVERVKNKAKKIKTGSPIMRLRQNNASSKSSNESVDTIYRFRGKFSKQGTIDVYWLFDDGGLTLLLPHILHYRPILSKCKLRVFFLANKIVDLDEETRNMAHLLSEFRIDCEDVIVLPDMTKKAGREIKNEFKAMVDGIVTENDLESHKDRTNFYLRMAETVRQHSSRHYEEVGKSMARIINPEMVVMTLPLQKKSISNPVPPILYMAWMDIVSKNMPPFFFIRGNQESVLTFYS